MNNFHMREGRVEFRWKRWRNKKRQEVSSCLMVLFSGVVLLGAGGVALAGPTGGQVTSGTGTITNPDGTTTNINQTSNVLSINWQDFSIQAGETVNFYQPGSNSVAINRVIGGVPSYLAGALNANGRVFILNSAGITFTGTSQVNVGALLATTAMTVNGDPSQVASYSGTGYGAIVNQGSISVSNGGFAILAAPYVQNTGFIKADLGTIALAGTNQFTLDLSGTGLINFVVPAGAVEKIVSDGKAVGVDNSGTLQARSGQVIISANVASEVINAVVNLNGVVDADAFAPNGQGGSVLVTGDAINVGGQVTARGSGAGAGGQIVTKAVEGDNIEQMAFVSAAGGATGKGGLVEVSGKQVGLHGDIEVGSGGSVYIDPHNIHVVNANIGLGTLSPGSTQVGSVIGTDFIENQLRHGANVNLEANANIYFDAMADDHKLVGGNGNLTLTAGNTGEGGNITFLGTNDAIVQAAGFIHMNANGGSIGGTGGLGGHAISLLTGGSSHFTQNTGIVVTHAGDIVLKAGHDVDVKNVQIKSSGNSSFTAKFSASAGNDFNASGNINLLANAHGAGSQNASASVNIFAHNNINVRNITVDAFANVTSNHGGDATGQAYLTLNAQGGSVQTRNLQVLGSAVSRGDHEAHGTASANIQAENNIDINGGVNVAALGISSNPSDNNSSVAGNANLLMNAVTGHVNVTKDVLVHAFARQRNSTADATASANINANTFLTINGNVGVTATADGSAGNAASDFAFANLRMRAATGDVTINHNVNVAAFACGFGTFLSSDANATAQASANIQGIHIDIGGNVSVVASAFQVGDHDSSSAANARANLLLNATSGHVNIGGDVIVAAFAQQFGSSSAKANARANIEGSNVTVNGNVTVRATADNLGTNVDGASACANLRMDASSGDITVNHNVTIEAFANSAGEETARANAQGCLFASDDIIVKGDVNAIASANQHGTDGSEAKACANLLMDASSGSVNVGGNIGVTAFAHGSGPSSALANARANITGEFDIKVGGDVHVSASADQNNIDGTAAKACANLLMHADSGSINVLGNVVGFANVAGQGHSSALANAQVNLSAESDIRIGGNVLVSADANQNNIGDGTEARACANLQMDATSGSINILGNVIGFAKALGQGHSSAQANALINLHAESDIRIGGGVTVSASADQNRTANGSSARACANLQMDATSGSINVTGSIFANARAHAEGTSFANANTLINLFAAEDVNINGSVQGHASADQNGTAGSAAHACANVNIRSGSSDININGGVLASANAFSKGSESAVANANVHLNIPGDVTVNGVVTANAHATADSTNVFSPNNGALAQASIDVHGDHVVLGGLDEHATATSHGSVNKANAVANAEITAPDRVEVDGSVTVDARAVDTNTQGAGAEANAQLLMHQFSSTSGGQLKVTGDITVLASANDHAHAGHANALANVQLIGNGDSSGFGGPVVDLGDVTVTANAHDANGTGMTLANAQLLVSAQEDERADIQMGSLDVVASAVENGDQSGAKASALANALLNAHDTANAIGNNVFVFANAFDGTSANANATLNVNALQITLGTDGPFDSDFVGGPVGARAKAVANDHNAQAHAIANVTLNAHTGDVTVFGTLTGVATASFNFHGGNALNNITATADVHVNAAGDIFLESANVAANAQDWGNKTAIAKASLDLEASGSIQLEDVQVVSATADNHGSNASPAASASANVKINGTHVIAAESSQSIVVRAHAINAGHKGVKATTKLSFGAATLVSVDGITLDVLASELRASDDGTGAHATADLVHTGGGALWKIGDHGINVQAVAHSNGTVGAFAHASVNIQQANVQIGGPVTVNALASAGVAAHGALATANLILKASTGDVNVGGGVFDPSSGSIFVKANAHNLGHNHAAAQADASLVGNNFVRTENITVEAIAFDSNADGAADTKANAQLFASGQGNQASIEAATVVALADRVSGTGANGAVAIANAHIIGDSFVFAEGGIAVLAIAQDPGGAYANATAELLASANNVIIGRSNNDMPVFSTGSIDVSLHANYGVLVGAIAIFSNSEGGGHAQADANANIVADTGFADIAGAADVLGVAVDQGGAFANADADLKVDANTFGTIGSGSLQLNIANHSGVFANVTLRDGIFVAAAAVDTANGHVDAGADASVNANHNNITIHGGVDELALGITSNGSYANAQAHLLVNAFDNTLITSGSITANIFGCEFNLGSLLGPVAGPHIGILQAAIASDGGAGTSHHANALAETNIDPNLVQINGDVIVAAAAFDNSGQGATANANLFIHANRVHIGTESGHGNIVVTAAASENGTQFGGNAIAQANAKIVATGTQSTAININGVTVLGLAFDANAPVGSTVVANAHMLLSASHGGVHVDGINVRASASIDSTGNTDAQANAVASINANRQINVNGDISVTAFANVHATSGLGDANAFAFLNMQAHNRIDVEGHILVSASAIDDADSSAVANASASINGNGITLNGGVDVEANARENSSAGTNALACANLNVHASTGSINVNGEVTVNAEAELFSGTEDALACAFANIIASDGQININGPITVTANAFDDTHSGTNAVATASLNIFANHGNVGLTGDVTVNAQADNHGTESALACANANIHTDTGNVTVIGNIDVIANAYQEGFSSTGDGAHACANLDVGAFGTDLQTINVLGNVTVNAQAQGTGSHSGSGGDSVTANARAQFGDADRQDVSVNGNISVTANASYSGSNAQDALACANLDMDASSGNLTIIGNVDVNAVAFTEGDASANANAKAELAAENDDFGGSNAGNTTITGNITVTANAELDNSSGDGAHACANLDVDASSGNITLTGNINVNANAKGNGSNGTESVTANAKTEIGDSSGFGTHGNIQVNGIITVTATADYDGSGGQDAIANANLKVVASSGFVTINGAINVQALATNDGSSGTARARTNVFVGAFGSPGNVTITGPVNTRARAFQTDFSGSNASAWANMAISASGNVQLFGPVTAHGTATNDGTQNASAFADIEINAVNVAAGDIGANAHATHFGSGLGNATATASINVHASNNIGIRGVRGSAFANLPDFLASGNANAQTNIHLTAGSNISVGPDGLFAGVKALDTSGGVAFANAELAVDAGTHGVGNIFIRGNDIARALAIGTTSDQAHANVHLAAGGATEFSTGAPSNFGNVVVLGNIGAFARADATNDKATASVEIFAHNNILIIGNDPIASAKIGLGSGTTFAFRQAHFTTNSTAVGPGGTAIADIDIRAGGEVTVVPTSSLSHILKLYAMPTDELTLNSSGGLTIIPLSVDGDDCGVLGIAGADQATIGKAKACKRKPINVSDLTDTGP